MALAVSSLSGVKEPPGVKPRGPAVDNLGRDTLANNWLNEGTRRFRAGQALYAAKAAAHNLVVPSWAICTSRLRVSMRSAAMNDLASDAAGPAPGRRRQAPGWPPQQP